MSAVRLGQLTRSQCVVLYAYTDLKTVERRGGGALAGALFVSGATAGEEEQEGADRRGDLGSLPQRSRWGPSR